MSGSIKVVYVIANILLSDYLYFVNGANILGLLGLASPSVQIHNDVLMRRLAELGHNVTVLSVDMPKSSENLPPNLHYIHLEKGYSMYDKDKADKKKMDISAYIGLGPFECIKFFYNFGVETIYGIVASNGFQTLLNYPDDFKFDLVINDYTLGPYLLGFVHKFRYPPLMGITTYHNTPLTIDAMFNHYFPAYVPYHSTVYTTEMTFFQRLVNTLVFIADTVYRRLVYLPQIDKIMRPYFGKDMPDLNDLQGRTAISLVSSHPAIDYPEPLPPNVIEIAGLQILDPKPVPKELDDFMNKSRKGVVLISFGTNMHGEDFDDSKINAIVSAISQLPEYNFLWKFDSKYLKVKLPSNVLVKSFFPQRDILAHPKIKVFVTHCGGLSSQEATWRGVPMVGIPLFLDQNRNSRQSVLAGVSIQLDFLTLAGDVLRDAIKKVAEDPKIIENVRRRSVQFRDRPMKPLDTSVWWVEYLLRNPDPRHLKSPAAKLNIFQANSLDVILFIWTVMLVLIYLAVKLVLLAMKIFRVTGKNANSQVKLKTK